MRAFASPMGIPGETPNMVSSWKWSAAGAFCALAVTYLSAVGVVEAQRPALIAGAAAPGEDSQSEEADEGVARARSVFGRADRSGLKWLNSARQLLRLGRYTEAARLLGSILDETTLPRPDDYFLLPDERESQGEFVRRSLKREARRLVGHFSPEARAAFELQYGAVARHQLRQAVETGNADALAAVLRRFYHTRAGYDAAFLLGLYHYDRHRPLAAGRLFQRLRDDCAEVDRYEPALSLLMAACWSRAGMPERAREAIEALQRRRPGLAVQIAGRRAPLVDGQDGAWGWLEAVSDQGVPGGGGSRGWLMFRGGPERNTGAETGGPVLSLRWRVPTTDHPFVESLLERLRHEDLERDRTVIAGLHPIVVDDMVLMRSVQTLQAVDVVTGKRIWEAPLDDSLDPVFRSAQHSLIEGRQPWEQALRARVWADATYGTLSSDGERVFTIEGLPVQMGRRLPRTIPVPIRRRAAGATAPWNRLAAYDVRTGQQVWEAGGEPGEAGGPLAGAFFLGPPLPLMGSLYGIMERDGEIRLVVLEAATGNLLWQQRLADAEVALFSEPLRQLMGVSPSYSAAHGMLICPTSNRSVVAVDLATRSLVWGYTYRRASEQSLINPFLPVFRFQDPRAGERWFDSSAMVAGDCVLVAPADSDQLHCIELAEGRLRWRLPRGEALYVACVHQGNVVLVEERLVRAVRLDRTTAEGQPAPGWEGRTIPLPVGVRPSGFGCRGGQLYYLPLSSAQVMAIDLNQGRVHHWATSREGCVPGNLVAYKDKIISQRATALEAFWELGALKHQVQSRLAANREDPGAWQLRGQMLWDEGQLDEAVACFQRAVEFGGGAEARELLRQALFDGLEHQFAAYEARGDQIESLLDTPDQRATFLRLMAAGLEEAGRYGEAIDRYIELVDLDAPALEMVDLSRARSVRRDRLVRVRLAGLRKKIPEQECQRLDELIRARRQEAEASPDGAQLERLWEWFAGQPAMEGAAFRLAEKLEQAGQWVRAEMVLRRAAPGEEHPQRPAALARLAALLRSAGRLDDAAWCYRELRERFADVPCVEGKTPSAMLDGLDEEDPLRQALAGGPAWPTGAVNVEVIAPQGAVPSSYSRQRLEFSSGRTPFYRDIDFALNRQHGLLVAMDGYGRKLWQLPLGESDESARLRIVAGLLRLSAQDHLLLVTMNGKLMAVDPSAEGPEGQPRVLWTRQLGNEGLPDWSAQIRVLGNVPAGAVRVFMGGDVFMPALPAPQAVSAELICLTRFRHLIAVDPYDGQTVWVRHDMKPGSELFGDAQYVFVVPPQEDAAVVLAAEDGRMLGRRPLPLERLATTGRCVLAWEEDNQRQRLVLYDPWGEKRLWSSGWFSPGAQVEIVDGLNAAVLEPGDGHFSLFDIRNGRRIIDAKLDEAQWAPDFSVLPVAGGYLFIGHLESPQPDPTRSVQPIGGVPSELIRRAAILAFDTQGRQLWPAPLVIRDQCLPRSQPRRLPVLVFACTYRHSTQSGRTRFGTALLCVDRRSGRVLFEEHFGWRNSAFALVGDPEKKTVEVQLQRATIRLTFTDQSWDEAGGEPDDSAKVSQALLRALRSSIGGDSGEMPSRVVSPAVPQGPPAAKQAGQADGPKPAAKGQESSKRKADKAPDETDRAKADRKREKGDRNEGQPQAPEEVKP